MLERLFELIKEAGLDPSDRKCIVINAICLYRGKNYMCKYTRLERALMMFDCAFE